MGKCGKCLADEAETRLVEAIYEGEILKLCERCASSEQALVIRKPSSFQLEASEKPYTVRQRLARMAGVKLREEAGNNMKEKAGVCERKEITLDNLRKPKDYSKILSEKFKKEEQVKSASSAPLDLVDNWNWHIQMERRNKKLTLAQLSSQIGEAEIVLKTLENGNLIDDAQRVISKIEQYFKITLRKSEAEREKARLESVKMPARVLSFNSETLKNITIDDLRKMKQARESENINSKNPGKNPESDIEIIDDED